MPELVSSVTLSPVPKTTKTLTPSKAIPVGFSEDCPCHINNQSLLILLTLVLQKFQYLITKKAAEIVITIRKSLFPIQTILCSIGIVVLLFQG
eukprot:1893201-Ditylum_brightwellii.AAC.1